MNVGEVVPWTTSRESCVLCGKYDFIDVSARALESSTYRISTRNVRRVAFEFNAGVDQTQVTVIELLIVRDVVQNGCVLATADDRRVGGTAATKPPKRMAECRFKFVLVATVSTNARGFLMCRA